MLALAAVSLLNPVLEQLEVILFFKVVLASPLVGAL
jgi:hypothetical protein